MSELNFKKFSDLDVLENISATSHVVIEEDGDVKRFPANGIGKVKSVNGVEPDENGNVQIEAGGVSSWNDLTDKPFYTGDPVEVELDINAIAEWDSESYDGTNYMHRAGTRVEQVTFIEGREYAVTINGAEYISVAKYVEYDGDICLALGDFEIYRETYGEDENFIYAIIIAQFDNYAMLDIIFNSGASSEAPTECKIIATKQEIKKIDRKYVGFGEEVHEAHVLEERTIDFELAPFGDGLFYWCYVNTDWLEEGNDYDYIVVWDDVRYELKCNCHEFDADSTIYIGNESYISDDTSGGDIPFNISSGAIITESKEPSHTISIIKRAKEVYQINNKYLGIKVLSIGEDGDGYYVCDYYGNRMSQKELNRFLEDTNSYNMPALLHLNYSMYGFPRCLPYLGTVYKDDIDHHVFEAIFRDAIFIVYVNTGSGEVTYSEESIITPAAAVSNAAGETPTAAEFNALLTSLRDAGYLAE